MSIAKHGWRRPYVTAELDWRGEVDATVFIAFGPDVDNEMMESTLGVIKADFDFHTAGGEFKIDKLKISAGVQFEKPAEAGSWQAAQGVAEIKVSGYVKINYPCTTETDETTGEVTPLPLFFGKVTADLALGSEDSPIFINGATAVIRYDCFGGTSLMVALKVKSLKIGEVFELRALELNFTMTENKTTELAWNFFGAIKGQVKLGEGGEHTGTIFMMCRAAAAAATTQVESTRVGPPRLMNVSALEYTIIQL